MNTQKRLKTILIDYLLAHRPSEDIEVIDSRQTSLAVLPSLAVSVPSVEPHSKALWSIERCQVSLTLRVHVGDEEDTDLDAWQEAIEAALADPEQITALGDEASLVIFDWTYNGSTVEWDESAIDTTFSADCLVTRNPINHN